MAESYLQRDFKDASQYFYTQTKNIIDISHGLDNPSRLGAKRFAQAALDLHEKDPAYAFANTEEMSLERLTSLSRHLVVEFYNALDADGRDFVQVNHADYTNTIFYGLQETLERRLLDAQKPPPSLMTSLYEFMALGND